MSVCQTPVHCQLAPGSYPTKSRYLKISPCKFHRFLLFSAMWSSISGWFTSQGNSNVCHRDLPQVYAGFVDYLMDTLHAESHTPCRESQIAPSPPLRLPAARRLVAIGDLHGDFEKTRKAFRIAGLIDAEDRWSGGEATAVQVGDQLDRGDEEVRILYFLERLQREAAKSGGALHVLNGNHETLNVAGRFRYSTPGGLDNFAAYTVLQGMAASMKEACGCRFGRQPAQFAASSQQTPAQFRYSALSPGGPIATRFLAPHPVVLQIGSTLFVHGGVLPSHVEYGLERINAETRTWMLGEGGHEMPAFLGGRDAVVWARDYSQEVAVCCTEDERRCDCKLLEQSLRMVAGAQRMVVGHTIQGAGINSACDNRVFRVDVGLSRGCGDGQPEVLEIIDDKEVRSLREGQPPKLFTADAGEKGAATWWWWRQEREGLPPHRPLQI